MRIEGHILNALKQLLGGSQEFLQRLSDYLHGVTLARLYRPLSALIMTLISGNWYRPVSMSPAGMLQATMATGLDALSRGMSRSRAQRLVSASWGIWVFIAPSIYPLVY